GAAARRTPATPAATESSGPITMRSTACARTASSSPRASSGPTGRRVKWRAIASLPGATSTSPTSGSRAIRHASACSRPPEPTTRTRSGRAMDALYPSPPPSVNARRAWLGLASRARGELLLEQLAHHLRVRAPARFLHDLPHQEAQRLRLPAQVLLHGSRVLVDHGAHDGLEVGLRRAHRVGGEQRRRICPAVEDLFEDGLAGLRGDGNGLDRLDH